MKEFILIRHGETDYNSQMKFMGMTDAPLNIKGKKEALLLKEKLKDDGINRIISSPLQRCTETASLIFPDSEIIMEKSFVEMNFGIFECLTYDEINEKYPEKMESWNLDRMNYKIPEGESIAEMSERVLKCFDKILNNYDGRTVIVTHSGTIRIILAHYLINSIHETWRFSVDHCRVTRLNFSDGYGYLKSLNE